KELALEAARKSIVLLKNDHQLLPMKKDIRTLAVIGPNADEWTMLLGNYNGLPSKAITPLEGIREKLAPGSRVLYARGSELAEGLPDFDKVPATVLSHDGAKGLQTDYYANKDFTGSILYSEADSDLNAVWGEGAPRKDLNDDDFGVKWKGELTPAVSGLYQLGIVTTCKVNLYLNDSLIANTSYHFRDEFNDPRLRKSKPVRLEAGKKYRIRVEAGESYGDARVQLVWSRQQPDIRRQLKKEAVATAKQADAVVLCMGLSARLEGEEMDVAIDGFDHGDRTTLDLPKIQQDLIKEITALGKPVVLVLLNGSAVSINWADQHVPAIVEAWYPGQAGGQAIADVLFGDYNPAGRLPVTFYTGLGDLPAFGDYAMAGRTYRYYKKPVLYPFGYGLSYTTFHYDNLKTEPPAHKGDSVRMTVDVKNTGALPGDEVTQVYVSALDAKVPVPILSLRGFRRIHLAAGETQTLRFSIDPAAFTVIDDKMQRVSLPGRYEISAGGGQPGAKASNSIHQTITIN
ncbi:MAG: glycoside hydrolase family 3 C-terminal domain-containing protein, partial [Bacteroidetes bacterium]|nr:glycoside hydrolase family 3 C-terminal domain-containing protein [Bacteroidota bacterium]